MNSKRLKKYLLLPTALLLITVTAILAYAIYKTARAQSLHLTVNIDNNRQYLISADNSGVDKNFFQTLKNLPDRKIYNPQKLKETIANIAEDVDIAPKNYSLVISGQNVNLDSSISAGQTLDQKAAYAEIANAIQNGKTSILIQTQQENPEVTIDNAEEAIAEARNIIKGGFWIAFNGNTLYVEPDTISSWIQAKPKDNALEIYFDSSKISSDLKNLTQAYQTSPQEMVFMTDNKNNLIQFTPPIPGQSIDTAKGIQDITNLLESREEFIGTQQLGSKDQPIQLDSLNTQPDTPQAAKDLGIVQEIGSATTTFTGSHKDRILNIGVGAKTLNNILIAPGEEFSTLKALGPINASAGYLPELSIIGNQTIPEYGGGLCQIATTLFRAALNTGLPITERQNHSYRVSYYEKDGNGKYIGPGLDATIYSPAPDLKFLNDTGHWILLTSSINSLKITFTMYGTPDGRKPQIDGPTILSKIPAPAAIYQQTDKLPQGTTKQTEIAHPGGKTTVTYTITYADGTIKKQVFNSYYRPWPARYLIGTGTSTTINANLLNPQD